MNTNLNKHYTNEHGMQLKDFMKTFMPELWKSACYWSALKYNVRAGKKAGEALGKDTGKRDDYINELVENDGLEDYSLILDDLDGIKERFENWKGEK